MPTAKTVVKKQRVFLVCESVDGEMHSFPHPDPSMLGKLDLVVPCDRPIIIDAFWLDDPNVILAIERGQIRTYESSTVPRLNEVTIPQELELHDPVLENNALQVLGPKWTPEVQSLILVEPRVDRLSGDRGGPVDRQYLQSTHLTWLRNVLLREQAGRKRAEVIALLERRIAEIRAM